MALETEHNLNGKGTPRDYRDLVAPGVTRRSDSPVHENGMTRPAATMTPWERVQVARHPDRPHTLDYIQKLCTDFVEMHGDRLYGDDAAIIAGLANFEGQTVMVIGHQKGRSTKENIARNFAQAQPEGYRKAKRLMEHAARFGFPILTFIDTPGASPSMQAEERGIGQSIAANLMTMLTVDVPIIVTIIGEGGSGGALAIAIGDRVLMLENSIYTVASPEAAASILWRDAGHAPAAAEAMHITADDLLSFDIVDEIVPEPDGGAHSDTQATVDAVREAIARNLDDLQTNYALRTKKGSRKLLEDRHRKYERMGTFVDAEESAEPRSGSTA